MSQTQTELNLFNPETGSLKQLLHESLNQALGSLKTFQQCALLSYPDHYNIGDHLIWIGNVFYLNDVLGLKIKYAASIESFSREEMEQRVGNAPVFLHGGGNLGDLWSYYQNFYEKIISAYHDRPVILLPQSIRFAYQNKLQRAIDVFNAHPNLILITRENRSYEFAKQHFHNCKIFKSPDLALQLLKMPFSLPLEPKQKDTILYLSRQDGELNQVSSPESIELANLIVEDWASYRYKGSPRAGSIQGISQLIQQGWQQGTVIPNEWISRQIWQRFHPEAAKFNSLYNPSMHRKSWNFIHNAVYQFKQHRLIITNRLHGHILCIILGIPHVFLANAYHKNEAFYETWTERVPFCRFVKDASQIKPAVQELIERYF
jgi:exopolysaccharide biosynthesis predicted pyruvyltransferase EpsI